MSNATFYHKHPAQVAGDGATATIRIYAQSADPSAVLADDEVVILNGQPEGDSHTVPMGAGETEAEKILAATRAFVVDIAGRRNPPITIALGDVTEVQAP